MKYSQLKKHVDENISATSRSSEKVRKLKKDKRTATVQTLSNGDNPLKGKG